MQKRESIWGALYFLFTVCILGCILGTFLFEASPEQQAVNYPLVYRPVLDGALGNWKLGEAQFSQNVFYTSWPITYTTESGQEEQLLLSNNHTLLDDDTNLAYQLEQKQLSLAIQQLQQQVAFPAGTELEGKNLYMAVTAYLEGYEGEILNNIVLTGDPMEYLGQTGILLMVRITAGSLQEYDSLAGQLEKRYGEITQSCGRPVNCYLEVSFGGQVTAKLYTHNQDISSALPGEAEREYDSRKKDCLWVMRGYYGIPHGWDMEADLSETRRAMLLEGTQPRFLGEVAP